MKEFIIVFLIALVISSVFNGWNPFASSAPGPGQEQSADSAFSSQPAPVAGQGATGNTTTPSGNPL